MSWGDNKEVQRLGRQITRFRLARDMSMRQLAELMDLSHQMVQKYESGKSDFPFSRIQQLTEIFNITYAEFLGEPPHTGQAEPTEDATPAMTVRHLNGQEERLLSAFNHLTERAQRKVVLDLVETMAFKTDHSAR